MGVKIITKNKRARREYIILEKMEAGISLLGAEVKAVRDGQVNFKDSYVSLTKNLEAWIEGLHIGLYKFADPSTQYSPTRRRKLLLNKHQIQKLFGKVTEKGMTIIPLAIYLRGPWIKVEIGLAKGKLLHDKRQDLIKKAQDRDIARAMKDRY